MTGVADSDAERLIPAYAGSTATAFYAPAPETAHPRLRGEHTHHEASHR